MTPTRRRHPERSRFCGAELIGSPRQAERHRAPSFRNVIEHHGVEKMEKSSPEPHLASEPQLRFGKIDDLSTRVGAAIDAARKYLFSEQHGDGYWCGELEADTT